MCVWGSRPVSSCTSDVLNNTILSNVLNATLLFIGSLPTIPRLDLFRQSLQLSTLAHPQNRGNSTLVFYS